MYSFAYKRKDAEKPRRDGCESEGLVYHWKSPGNRIDLKSHRESTPTTHGGPCGTKKDIDAEKEATRKKAPAKKHDTWSVIMRVATPREKKKTLGYPQKERKWGANERPRWGSCARRKERKDLATVKESDIRNWGASAEDLVAEKNGKGIAKGRGTPFGDRFLTVDVYLGEKKKKKKKRAIVVRPERESEKREKGSKLHPRKRTECRSS